MAYSLKECENKEATGCRIASTERQGLSLDKSGMRSAQL